MNSYFGKYMELFDSKLSTSYMSAKALQIFLNEVLEFGRYFATKDRLLSHKYYQVFLKHSSDIWGVRLEFAIILSNDLSRLEEAMQQINQTLKDFDKSMLNNRTHSTSYQHDIQHILLTKMIILTRINKYTWYSQRYVCEKIRVLQRAKQEAFLCNQVFQKHPSTKYLLQNL
ncbi:hypothetical protein RFI_08235 [Reticulomyxa filosa]|uniref:Uncharacterized protein n=1 Tax=Reticulomyxa filosa TaxID=46433 RepID=X6NRJ2_RETFI|nr:hypothetical protein RFI_08235 [Reticulomyxa filosa]|eukprot:ETO28890.1 hypothetical protein RFI_08235 [Reticulomyxa filosa]